MTTFSLLHLTPLFPIFPLLALTLKQTSFMMSLLSLEAAILMLVLATSSFMGTSMACEPFLCLMILVFGACEASLGLGIMVTIMRSYGNDSTKSLTMSKC